MWYVKNLILSISVVTVAQSFGQQLQQQHASDAALLSYANAQDMITIVSYALRYQDFGPYLPANDPSIKLYIETIKKLRLVARLAGPYETIIRRAVSQNLGEQVAVETAKKALCNEEIHKLLQLISCTTSRPLRLALFAALPTVYAQFAAHYEVLMNDDPEINDLGRGLQGLLNSESHFGVISPAEANEVRWWIAHERALERPGALAQYIKRVQPEGVVWMGRAVPLSEIPVHQILVAAIVEELAKLKNGRKILRNLRPDIEQWLNASMRHDDGRRELLVCDAIRVFIKKIAAEGPKPCWPGAAV